METMGHGDGDMGKGHRDMGMVGWMDGGITPHSWWDHPGVLIPPVELYSNPTI